MNREEENSKTIGPIIGAVSSPYIIGSVKAKEFELSLLCDISKSLAVIADKITKEKDDKLS